MSNSDKDFIVAIEFGSSKICGIAGKKKDGSMQILAYAEEKSEGCIKRGVVYNIEKTHQCVNNIISKLENVLKTKISRAYVGVGGQSVRSFKSIIARNLLTQSYITNEVIDSIQVESTEIPYNDYEVLENFPQEYVVDTSVIADPVGVMGTNIEGGFLNIIAKSNLRANIETVFGHVGIGVVEQFISPLQLANNVLTDAEKRSGCALVDLGADTTTLVVYKNNIVRYLVTIPLGCNNINKDLATLPIDETETEEVKIKYGDACQEFEISEDMEPQTYTTSDGRNVEVSLIKNVIEARMGEIIANVSNQIINSDYSGKLLAGLVITGGGSKMKNITKAFVKSTKIDKVRVASKVNQNVVKTSNAASLKVDDCSSTTILSLLLAGKEPCGGDEIGRDPDLFDRQAAEEERQKAAEIAAAAAAEEAAAVKVYEAVLEEIRAAIGDVKKMDEELKKNSKDKKVRQKAKNMALTILDEKIGEGYEKATQGLQGKEKFKLSLKGGNELAEKLKEAVDQLTQHVGEAEKANSAWSKFKRTLTDLVSDGE